ncbi:unnamed protein product [Sphagnum jensenii]|uniref:Uncharacterized protein n=1 Tax=Sphagnum jensenii TaxID=128206 RepID=A0ABP1A858_9BRYO
MMDRNQDILFLDMSQVDQAQDLFYWERGRGKTEEKDMEACALVPTWSCEFHKSSSQLQWREELMDFNALLTRESE